MKGILFTPDNLKAIMEGRKTQTRRLIKPQPISHSNNWWSYQAKGITTSFKTGEQTPEMLELARYHVGEVVYVKEAWCQVGDGHDNPFVVYKLTTPDQGCKWHSPLYMPAWAARTLIQIEDVRVQRLQDITEEDAKAEGIVWVEQETAPGTGIFEPCAVKEYRRLWNSINKKPGTRWEDNLWVFAYTFRVVSRLKGIL